MKLRALGLSLLMACGGSGPPDVVEPSARVPAPAPSVAAPAAFENPGGMWTPAQLADHADTLKQLGLALDPKALTDPMAFPLGAIVWLGGCTGSFVSPDGLIVTNHHCAVSALQYSSTEEENLLEDGFLAKTRAEEKSNGPAARIFVTRAFDDVSAEMREGLEAMVDPQKRYEALESREKAIVAACEKDRPDVRCRVVSYFGGERYVSIEQLELRDVRLVHAPAAGVGVFGGETDNWRWPRHTGDYSFFRVYVGKDGQPADYAADNVPYRPPHHLTVAGEPLGEGDLVMVAGYPGRTSRLKTAKEVEEAVQWYYPRRQKMCEDYLGILEPLAAKDPVLARKSNSLIRGLSNVLTNTKGMLDGLVKGGLLNEKREQEAALRAWAAQQPAYAEAPTAMDALAAHYAKYRGKRDADAALGEVFAFPTLTGAAHTIVKMAEERPKPDEEREPGYQDRDQERLEQGMRQAQRSYDPRKDQALVALALRRAAALEERPEWLANVVTGEPTDAAIDRAVKALYSTTGLGDEETRVELVKTATTAQLKRSRDPLIRLALALHSAIQASEDRTEAYAGATVIDRPRFVAALRAKRDGVLAPDANSTLRVTYGTVRGYRPSVDAPMYSPFTTLSGMVKKHTGEDPFDAPRAIVEAAEEGPFQPYVHEPLGEVPVNFLADLDITGGNSGSPTLNARGELVGLVFDGNYESMASDWVFMPDITRSIHVDIRYVLWIMDRVDGADHLLREMGVTPKL